jgi:choline dehydrogenase-like flavoprotein
VPYDNFEFWREHRGLYSPRYTLEELIRQDRVDYRSGYLVRRFVEDENGVTVLATGIAGGDNESFRARHVLLAAGAINSARIVLQSFGDHEARLALLENPAIQIPFVLPAMLGSALETDAFGLVQLNLAWDSDTYGGLCQASLMEITSPLRAEFFASLPYSAPANLGLIRHLLPAMIVMQLFLPQEPRDSARMRLEVGGRLEITGGGADPDPGKAGPLLAFMRRLGAWSFPMLIARVPSGHAIHYAGTLPMRERPGRYECTPGGLLAGTARVYVGDSAGFPHLPAKNMSFGMMANAMRVAAGIATRIQAER